METVDLLVVNAHELVTCRAPVRGARGARSRDLEVIRAGALAVNDGRIVGLGTSADLRGRFRAQREIDASGCLVTPGLVDPHSHLLHAGSRHAELEQRIGGDAPETGLSGGIQWTVEMTRQATDDALLTQAGNDLDVMLRHGTTTLEAKSGYALERDGELRLLRLTAQLEHPIDIVPTFLGAHILPDRYADDRDSFVDLVIDMIPEAADHARYCDMFCDPGGFTTTECRRMGQAARAAGLGVRLHADQTGDGGGAELAAALDAASADHLDHISPSGVASLAASDTAAVLVPGVTYHMLEMVAPVDDGVLGEADKPFLPQVARRLSNAGALVAISTDYNPGTSPTRSMQTVMQLAARLYRLHYAEIWHAATINAARALDRDGDRGSLEVGKHADVVVWDVAEHGMVIDRFGTNLANTVLKDGTVVVEHGQPVGTAASATRDYRSITAERKS